MIKISPQYDPAYASPPCECRCCEARRQYSRSLQEDDDGQIEHTADDAAAFQGRPAVYEGEDGA